MVYFRLPSSILTLFHLEPTTNHEDQDILDTASDKVDPVSQTAENQIGELFPKPDLLAPGQCEANVRRTRSLAQLSLPTFLPLKDAAGFCCVISMHDGLVLYTTPSLTSILGFPKDTWLGHSFIDFVHPKDRDTFSTKVSTSVGLPLVDYNGKGKEAYLATPVMLREFGNVAVSDVRNCLYACLRRHVSTEVPLVEKPIPYQPFNLTVTIKQMAESPESGLADHNCMFLFIVAVPVFSAYKGTDGPTFPGAH